jgi:hypothetical protein
MAALPIVMTLIFGAPTFAAMTPTLWAIFALGQVGNIRGAIKTEKQLAAFVNSPAFRAWAAANGEAAIRLQPGEVTER